MENTIALMEKLWPSSATMKLTQLMMTPSEFEILIFLVLIPALHTPTIMMKIFMKIINHKKLFLKTLLHGRSKKMVLELTRLVLLLSEEPRFQMLRDQILNSSTLVMLESTQPDSKTHTLLVLPTAPNPALILTPEVSSPPEMKDST